MDLSMHPKGDSMAFGYSVALDGAVVLEDVRISPRNTISIPRDVLKQLHVGPRDYLRFLRTTDGVFAVQGMTLHGTELEQIADDRVSDIRKGASLTLDQIREAKG
jgi:hypothetical protein